MFDIPLGVLWKLLVSSVCNFPQVYLKDDGLGLGLSLGVSSTGDSLLTESYCGVSEISFCFSLFIVDSKRVYVKPFLLESYPENFGDSPSSLSIWVNRLKNGLDDLFYWGDISFLNILSPSCVLWKTRVMDRMIVDGDWRSEPILLTGLFSISLARFYMILLYSLIKSLSFRLVLIK